MELQEYILMDAEEHRLWWFRMLHRHLIAALGEVQGRVLDAGCGTGGFLSVLGKAHRGIKLEGLEFDPMAVELASSKSRAKITRGSITEMPYIDAKFDAAICADVLCHEKVDPAQALSELRRVLKPGGKLVLNMPAYQWLYSAHDRRVCNARRSTPREIRKWLKAAGFVDVKTRYWNSLLLPVMVVQRKLLARDANADSDVATISPILNAILLAIAQAESHLPALPWGGSILAVAHAPDA